MAIRERIALWVRPAVFLGSNPLTLIGAVITTSTGLTLVGFWIAEMFFSGHMHPYAGIVFYMVLPSLFVLGLVLIPLGAWLRWRKLRAKGDLPVQYPKIDFAEPMLRRAVALLALLTFFNVAMLGMASYKGVEYMDSVQFCGQTCHSVMAPEYAAYVDSPHSRVACVECHIGPGAPWFVRSKLSGARQVFAVNLKTFSRPIPSPVHQLRPARETCEQCHWPQKFVGDKFLVRTKYSDDEKNTPLTTVLVLKIGGRTLQGAAGIHGRHLDTTERIGYISIDDRRQVIPRVTYLDDNGKTVEFASTDVQATPEQIAKGEHRRMDCMDCHNRPTHAFQLPERAVDTAMSTGRISPELPFIKKKAVEVLRTEYPDRGTATQKIAETLTAFYRSSYPEVYQQHRAQIEAAVDQVQKIYLRNIFPEMKVTWGTYPNNLGHEDFLGCFRCHDGSHVTSDGRAINADCTACHTILAMEDPNPKVLSDLGIK